jgi:hypothetical protein
MANLGRRLVLVLAFVDDLANHVFGGPGQVLDLGYEFGTYPMHPALRER